MKNMKILVFIAKIVDKTISALSTVLIILLLLYSGFSIWNTHMILDGAFTDDRLSQYKPVDKDNPPSDNPSDNSEQFPSNQDILIDINQDYKSWITIFDTHIDYPLVQGKDNLEYVNKDFYGEFSVSGVPFLDYRNASDFSDNYNLLYGHNMNNGAMFGDVMNFLDENYFNQHLTGELYALDKTYDIYLFASFETYATDTHIFIPGNFNDSQMQQLLDYIKAIAVVYKDIGVTTDSKLICLTTCSNYSNNKRGVLVGLLVERT